MDFRMTFIAYCPLSEIDLTVAAELGTAVDWFFSYDEMVSEYGKCEYTLLEFYDNNFDKIYIN